MNFKKCFCIISMLFTTACSNAQNRCYLFKHGQLAGTQNYDCGIATIWKDESVYLKESQYQSEKDRLDVECQTMYNANRKLYKQNPYAELVLPNEIMVVLYCVQKKEITKGSYCTNTFYECVKSTDGKEVVNRINERIKSDPKTSFTIFRKIVNGENTKIND